MTRASRAADSENAWKIDTIAHVAGGLNTSAPSFLIADEETETCINMDLGGNRARTALGYAQVGTGTLRGTPKGVFHHQDASGNAQIIVVTDDTFYKYQSNYSQWQYVSDGVSTDVAGAGEIIGATVIDVLDTTGFSVDDYIGITQDDGTQHQAQVTAVGAGAPGTLTIDVGLTDEASAGNDVVKALDLAGSDSYQVVFEAVPSNEWTVFTNGVDYPHRYDGSTVEPIPNLPQGGDVVCRTLALYKAGYLMLGDLVDGGTNRPYKIYWCDAGDPTNWSTGDAGYVNLVDARDTITAMKPLGDYMIVYRRRSIVRGEFLGLPSATFFWRTTVHGKSITAKGAGVVSPNSVFELPNEHIFAGRSGLYSYDGGFSVTPVSDKVYETIFSSRGAIDASKNHHCFMGYTDKDGELYYFFADKDGTFPDRAIGLNIREGKMRERWYRREFTAVGGKLQGTGEEPQIQDLVGAISEQQWRIGGASVVGDSPSMLMCGTDKKIYEYDYVTPQEAGGGVNWAIRTKRLRSVERYLRHAWVEVDYVGGPIAFLRVKDGGGLAVLKTLPAVGKMTHVRVYSDFVDKSIQYGFVAAAASELGAISVKYKEVSQWTL